jgi:hypothetical protein
MADWYLKSYGSNPFDSNSYIFVGSTAPACPGNGYVCAVHAEDNGSGRPVLTPALLLEIHTALNTNTDQPNVLLRAQP